MVNISAPWNIWELDHGIPRENRNWKQTIFPWHIVLVNCPVSQSFDSACFENKSTYKSSMTLRLSIETTPGEDWKPPHIHVGETGIFRIVIPMLLVISLHDPGPTYERCKTPDG